MLDLTDIQYSFLSPIGRHRSEHVVPSKGKRSKKRKRQEAKLKEEPTTISSAPPSPEISPFVVVGLNTITRNLELSSQKVVPLTLHGSSDTQIVDEGSQQDVVMAEDSSTERKSLGTSKTPKATEGSLQHNGTHFAAIFVLRSSQPAVLHAHLPQLIATASLAHPQLLPTKLVQLPKGCDARLCAALGLSRVSFIGILEGAPYSKTLLDLVRESVRDVEIKWLQEMQTPLYNPVKINMIESFAPVVKKQSK